MGDNNRLERETLIEAEVRGLPIAEENARTNEQVHFNGERGIG